MSDVTTTVPCDVEGCDHVADSNQRLGLHKFQAHGIRSTAPKRKRGRPRKTATDPLDADAVVSIVLEQVCPNGIPAAKLSIVFAWWKATEKFMQEMK